MKFNNETSNVLSRMANELYLHAIDNADSLANHELHELYNIVIDMDIQVGNLVNSKSTDDSYVMYNFNRRELSNILKERGYDKHIRIFNVDAISNHTSNNIWEKS